MRMGIISRKERKIGNTANTAISSRESSVSRRTPSVSRRALSAVLSLGLVLSSVPMAFATDEGLQPTPNTTTGTIAAITSTTTVVATATDPGNQLLTAYMKPDVTVRYNAQIMEFYNANGEVVYPIIYNGSTYLPVRAVASLMNEEVEWRDVLKTIFIGKTLSNPMKVNRGNRDAYAKVVSESAVRLGNAAVTQIQLVQRPNFKVMYDFVEQTFTNENGEVIYPLVYNGTTYLPLRSIATLMNEACDWDNTTKTVYIGSKTLISKVEEEKYKISETTQKIQKYFEDVSEVYNDATAEITKLQTISSPDDFQNLAINVSRAYTKAAELTSDIRQFRAGFMAEPDTVNATSPATAAGNSTPEAETTAPAEVVLTGLTGDEETALEAVLKFAGMTEYYILSMENIVYMMLEGDDFTIMEDTFSQYAYDSAMASEAARLAVEAL